MKYFLNPLLTHFCSLGCAKVICLFYCALFLSHCQPGEGESQAKPSAGKTQRADLQSSPFLKTPGPPVELPAVQIGKQTWTNRNLDVGQFRNGDPIPQVQDETAWEKASREGQPAWCYFKNDPEIGTKWGALYNFHAVVDPRGLAPEGWHVPEKAEWQVLFEHLGGRKLAATPMKDLEFWNERQEAKASGFNALPCLGRFDSGTFIDLPPLAYWWTATEYDEKRAYHIAISWDDPSIADPSALKGYGYSIRLVKD